MIFEFIFGAFVLVCDLVAIGGILRAPRDTSWKILWTVGVLVFPVVGMIAWFIFGRDRA